MRDFFYNKGDVMIATIIILVAAFVIYVRVGIIMDYPSDEGFLPMPVFGNTEEDSAASTASTGGDNGTQGAGGSAEEPGAGQGSQPGQTQEPEPEQPTTEPEDPAVPTSVQITVNTGDSASTIADKLLAAGAITDKEAFLADVMAQGADVRLRTGTFTIPAGSSHLEIIAILVT